MIDTSAIDPHWPADVAAFAQEQPPLLDVGPAYCAHREPTAGGFCPDCETSVSLKIETPAPPFAGLTISKSEIGVLRRCPRRYQYEYVLGRTPAAGPGIEAQWGTALHRGLESFELDLKSCEEHGLAIAWDLAVRDAIAAALTPTDDYAPPADPYARAALRAMLRAYPLAWSDDAERYEVLAVELPFDLPVLTAEGRVSRGRREGARREGRIDLMLRERSTGATWVSEHKSTGKPPAEDRFYLGIDLDLQSALYFDAARELGYEPAGVLYDVVRRPDFDDPKPAPIVKPPPPIRYKKDGVTPRKTRPRKERVPKEDVKYTNPRHGEPAAVYEERVYQLAIERPGDYFHRRALTIEPWQIEESRRMVHAAALEIAWRTRENLWPEVGDRYVCGARGMVCPWIDVCGRREAATNDRLFPMKRKKEIENT